MALGTTNISTTLVRNTLGESNNNVFLLCTSELINKWSRYKPVRDAGAGVNRPRGFLGLFGLNLPTNWDYLHPRGGSPGGTPDEPGRLGDFREYKHDAIPPFQLTTYPSATQLNVDTFTFAITVNENDITVEDLVLEDWYFGVLVDSVFYSAAHPLGDRATEIEARTIQAGPLAAGSHTWSAYISQYQTTAGETPDTVIALPAYGSYVISGSFSLTLEAPHIHVINNSSIVPTRGSIGVYIDGSYVRFSALNTGADQWVSFYDDETDTLLNTVLINAGDSETGLPATTGDVSIAAPTGWGSDIHIRIEDYI